MSLFRLFRSAKANQRLAPCLIRWHPAPQIFFDGQLQMSI